MVSLCRAHIIETRLEEEQAALTKRQLGYHRQDKEKSSDDDEYEKYVHEAQFKIQILKQRRDRWETRAHLCILHEKKSASINITSRDVMPF